MTKLQPFNPLPKSSGFCIVVPDFLSRAECAQLIALSESRGYVAASTDYPPSYRNNDRHVFDSLELANLMTERLRPYVPENLTNHDGDWQLDLINERFRFCRYSPGQKFNLHQDGVHYREPNLRSCITFMIYLTDGDDFAGGDTVFYSAGPTGAEKCSSKCETGRVRPRAGSLILFDHEIWHAGEQVISGIKHVMRSDVIYRRATNFRPKTERSNASGHEGYVWTLTGLGKNQYASGGRDAIIRIWNQLGTELHQLRGHDQSVLGLATLSGQRLASVSRDRSLKIWSLEKGCLEKSTKAHDAAVLDILSLPSNQLLTCGADGLIKLWDEQGEHLACLAGHDSWVWQIVRLGQVRWASASEDGSVRIWDERTHDCTTKLHGNVPLRTLISIGDAIWTGDVDGYVTCWQEYDGKWSKTHCSRAHGAAVRRLRQIDSGQVASCGEDNLLRIWDPTTGEFLYEVRHNNFVTDVLNIGDGIVSASYDGQLRRHPYVTSNET